jgi:AraC-like DNA-binding protein
MRPNPASSLNGVWQYWRPPDSSLVELGTVCGREVALPTHFHEEDQITFVLSGRRRFIIGDELADVTSGQAAHIPAGTPHRSLSGPSEVTCLNIYTPPGAYSVCNLISGLARLWQRKEHIGWSDLAAIVDEHRCLRETTADRIDREYACQKPWRTVSQAAQLAGISREGFSRRFRKLHGVPPHTFWLLTKLNDARTLLRTGEPIAAVAAETGFSDQSHLGRCFRRVFGVTPGQYRVG